MKIQSPAVFAVFKPKGPTSHDMIYKIKKLFPGEKVGHAGTLDPLASGVLVVGVGRSATKTLHSEEFSEKEYTATIKLGEYSTTDDEEGRKTAVASEYRPSESEVKVALQKFVGEIKQVPPQYSAVKVAGVPAYKSARKGRETDLKSRTVKIFNVEFISYEWPYLRILVKTGPGVYIRSLARDLGAELGVGGYIAELERTRVGHFSLDQTISLNELSRD